FLLGEAFGHFIEGGGELADFIGAADGDFEEEIAAAHGFGAGNQFVKRNGKAVGDHEAQDEGDKKREGGEAEDLEAEFLFGAHGGSEGIERDLKGGGELGIGIHQAVEQALGSAAEIDAKSALGRSVGQDAGSENAGEVLAEVFGNGFGVELVV